MKKYYFLVSLCSLLFTSSVNAASSSGWGTITELNMPASGNFIRISFDKPIVNVGCGAGDFYIRELDGTAGSNRFISMVTTAFIAGKQVQFWIDRCTAAQYWGATRASPYDIYIKQ